MYDVIVIGAGPIGAYTAYRLADQGFAVALLEEDPAVGKDVICTGIIGKEAFSRFDLPRDSIITAVRSFTFISPSGQQLQYYHPGDLAYVVDRGRFDQGIFELAKKREVDVQLGVRVKSVRREASGVRCLVTNGGNGSRDRINPNDQIPNPNDVGQKEYWAKAVVIATGVNYRLQRSLGMGSPPGFLLGAQAELAVAGTNSSIEIYTGQEVVPGSFGWVVPLGDGRSRVGVLSRSKARFYLERLIREHLNHRIGAIKPDDIREKPIAYGAITQSVADGVLAVGEAAGQVKTTTGGGIFYGLLGSELAVEVLSKGLHNGELSRSYLNRYEMRWRKQLSLELAAGYRARRIAEGLDDELLERCFSIVKQNRMLVEFIKRYINFEYHSKLLSFCFKIFGVLGIRD